MKSCVGSFIRTIIIFVTNILNNYLQLNKEFHLKGGPSWICSDNYVSGCNAFSVFLNGGIFLKRNMLHPLAGYRMQGPEGEGAQIWLGIGIYPQSIHHFNGG